VLRHSGENTLVRSAKVPRYSPQNRGRPVQGIDIRLRAICPRANRSGYAYCDEDAHFARRQAFGLDDIDSPTHYVEHAAKTLFLVLVPLTEQKWVTLAERRGTVCG
jgi:hypothetical protein